MDNAMHFFDELKKGMQQVEQAIEDWDYQDFSPDKRRALLEEQVSNDVADDLNPETDAIHQIQVARQQLNWSGLSPDDELADFDVSTDAASASTTTTDIESKLVILSTPAGGIQGVPDADTIHRFMTKAQRMDPRALTQALVMRLHDAATCWQIRSKALVLIQALTESAQLASHYLPQFQQHATLTQQLESLRTTDHNHIVRENARRALSLVQSNGSNATLIAKEPSVAKPHVRHYTDCDSTIASVRKTRIAKPLPANTAKRTALVPPAPIKVDALRQQQQQPTADAAGAQQKVTSPTITRAARASWRRRTSQTDMDANSNPNMLPFQAPAKMTMPAAAIMHSDSSSGSIVHTDASASRYLSARQNSAFTFIK